MNRLSRQYQLFTHDTYSDQANLVPKTSVEKFHRQIIDIVLYNMGTPALDHSPLPNLFAPWYDFGHSKF